MDTGINDPAFATAMARRLHEHYQEWAGRQRPGEPEPAADLKEAREQRLEAIARP